MSEGISRNIYIDSEELAQELRYNPDLFVEVLNSMGDFYMNEKDIISYYRVKLLKSCNKELNSSSRDFFKWLLEMTEEKSPQ